MFQPTNINIIKQHLLQAKSNQSTNNKTFDYSNCQQKIEYKTALCQPIFQSKRPNKRHLDSEIAKQCKIIKKKKMLGVLQTNL